MNILVIGVSFYYNSPILYLFYCKNLDFFKVTVLDIFAPANKTTGDCASFVWQLWKRNHNLAAS